MYKHGLRELLLFRLCESAKIHQIFINGGENYLCSNLVIFDGTIFFFNESWGFSTSIFHLTIGEIRELIIENLKTVEHIHCYFLYLTIVWKFSYFLIILFYWKSPLRIHPNASVLRSERLPCRPQTITKTCCTLLLLSVASIVLAAFNLQLNISICLINSLIIVSLHNCIVIVVTCTMHSHSAPTTALTTLGVKLLYQHNTLANVKWKRWIEKWPRITRKSVISRAWN